MKCYKCSKPLDQTKQYFTLELKERRGSFDRIGNTTEVIICLECNVLVKQLLRPY